MALEYLENRDITIPAAITCLKDFVNLWNELRRRKIVEIRVIKNELQFMTNIQLTTTWTENSIERLKNIIMINIAQYRDEISEIGALFDSAVEEIKIVPSIMDWCKSNGIDESSADRAGKCLRNRATGKHLILISELVSDDEKQSIIDAMHVRGSATNDIELL
jgi:hypothetical protein